MEESWYTLFGYGKDLTALQVCVRAALMFFIAIILVVLVVLEYLEKNLLLMR